MRVQNIFRILSATLMVVVSSFASAKLTLHSLVSDNMVLQQQSDVCLWGQAAPGSRVTVMLSWQKSGEAASTKAGDDGRWMINVRTPEASFDTHRIAVYETASRSVTDSVVVEDVLVGEVWLAAGQSNMEMPLKGFGGCCVKDGVLHAMQAKRLSPYVRMYKVPKRQSMKRQEECSGAWATPEFRNAMDYSATAYFFASALSNALQVPVGIVNCSYGGSHVESWISDDVCRRYEDIPQDSLGIYNFGKWDFDRPMLMYNAMFHPVRHYAYKGIIWYQGCSNVGHHDVYAQRLADMVSLWRSDIGQGDIPFYQVQLAPYVFGEDASSTGGARLREAQYEAQFIIPNSDIVCINDLVLPSELYNIHPSNKQPVGVRLSLLALNKTYGMTDIACSGPRFNKKKFRIENGKAVVGFDTNEYGICRNYGLEGFEIAGEDRKFYPATAEFKWQTNEVFLSAEEVPEPVAVRYCFKDFQIGNLIGGNELPLFPFRTDNWE